MVVVKYSTPIDGQPQFFEMNHDQNIMMISSNTSCIYYNSHQTKETDVDDKYDSTAIKESKYDKDENAFFILENKMHGKLGFFVIRMFASDPDNYEYLVRGKNKLEIGDTKI